MTFIANSYICFVVANYKRVFDQREGQGLVVLDGNVNISPNRDKVLNPVRVSK